MSYILDALRKADAERERGAVPGLHTQPVPAASAADMSRRGVAPAVWVIGGALLLGAGVIAWTFTGTHATRPIDAAAPGPVAEPAPAPASLPPVALAPAPASVLSMAPKPAPIEPVALAAAKASDADARLYAVNELPDTIRHSLPNLAVGGSIYSDTPASRFLIINGRIFHEGDKIANDLSLEQIKLKAAVLRFKGYRVGITF